MRVGEGEVNVVGWVVVVLGVIVGGINEGVVEYEEVGIGGREGVGVGVRVGGEGVGVMIDRVGDGEFEEGVRVWVGGEEGVEVVVEGVEVLIVVMLGIMGG